MDASEAKFKLYAEASPDGLFVADRNGVLVEVNPAASKITGYPVEELVGMNVLQLSAREDVDATKAHFQAVVGHGRSSGELPFKRKDGTTGFWSVDAVQLSNDRFMAFVKDTTARRLAEDKISMYKTLFDRANFGMVIACLDGIIVAVNDAFARPHGLTCEDVVGRHLSIFHAPDQVNRVNELVEILVEQGQFGEITVMHARRDGTPFPMRMKGFVVRDEKGDAKFLGATGNELDKHGD